VASRGTVGLIGIGVGVGWFICGIELKLEPSVWEKFRNTLKVRQRERWLHLPEGYKTLYVGLEDRALAPGSQRLIDMGVEPFLISASLECVLAQRLIRKICSDCRAPYEPTESVLRSLGLTPHDIGDKNFYYGKGCDVCNQTGYRGRKGIYELLKITDPLRDLINNRAPTVVIRQKAIELGMTTLREDGLRSIYDGITTIEEVVKYT